MVGRRERKPVADAVPPSRDAKRSLGRDVNRVGLEAFDRRGESAARKQGQPDLRIGRTRNRPETVWGDDRDRMAEPLELAASPAQRRDDAVDLRFPGIGHDCKLHGMSVRLQHRSVNQHSLCSCY